MRKGMIISFVLLVAVIVGSAWYAQGHKAPADSTPKKIQVVAAENFWGSIASQIGGNKVNVLSIVSDPNADPHEYESNATDARAVATADYVVVNGVGYDDWATKLIGASSSSKRVVLNVGNLVGKQEGDNPHLWYNPTYVNEAAAKMEQNLITIAPSDKAYFQAQYKILLSNLAPYQNRIVQIKKQFGGTKVAATEDIFAYLAQASGLDLISPASFTEAVAEGNDPPANSIVEFQQQLQSGQIKVLVYNEQTVTPLTDTMKQLAAQKNIPVVGVTETIQPPNVSFEVWMNAELLQLENALNANALGQ
jgi:zinc/manganese transport system substrate-binding protein